MTIDDALNKIATNARTFEEIEISDTIDSEIKRLRKEIDLYQEQNELDLACVVHATNYIEIANREMENLRKEVVHYQDVLESYRGTYAREKERAEAAETEYQRLRQMINETETALGISGIYAKFEADNQKLQEELSQAKREASDLATFLYKKYYQEESPEWNLLDSVAGIISQIDNMITGLCKIEHVEATEKN